MGGGDCDVVCARRRSAFHVAAVPPDLLPEVACQEVIRVAGWHAPFFRNTTACRISSCCNNGACPRKSTGGTHLLDSQRRRTQLVGCCGIDGWVQSLHHGRRSSRP